MEEWLTAKCGVGIFDEVDEGKVSAYQLGVNEVCRGNVLLSEAKISQQKPYTKSLGR